MPSKDHRRSKSAVEVVDPDSNDKPPHTDSASSVILSDYEQMLSGPDPSASHHFEFSLTSNSNFSQNQGQDITTHTVAFQEVFGTVDNEENKTNFVAKHGELFVKEHHGLISDTNARLVFRHVPDMQEGHDVKPVQDMGLGLNANWPEEVYQANLTQAFKDGQNATLAITSNRNGYVIYTGTTLIPPDHKDADGNLIRYTGDFQAEIPHDNKGISKIEAKGGLSSENPKIRGGQATENGYTYRFVAGPAFRSDGVSGIIDGSLRFNETNRSKLGGADEQERRSCEFNLICIIPQHGADYRPEFKASIAFEKERPGYRLSEQPQSKILDRFRMEILSDGDDKHRIETSYGRVWESGTAGSRKELNFKGYCGQDRGKSDYGAYFEYRCTWGASSRDRTNATEKKSHPPAAELKHNTPSANTGPVSQDSQGPFKNSRLDRYHAAVKDGDSALADKIANEFAQSPEGQRMAEHGDRLLGRQQAHDQQTAQAPMPKEPVMRI